MEMGNRTGTGQRNGSASQSERRFVLPQDSTKFIDGIVKENVCKINPSLSHNRILQISKDRNDRDLYDSALASKLKQRPVEAREFCDKELISIMKLANERNKSIAQEFSRSMEYSYKPGKLIIGTGSSTPYGNVQMLRLHSIYGVPYLPATAIKGSIRTCWILDEFEGDEKKAEKNASFRSLFGSADDEEGGERGALVFFDIFPSTFTIGLDVQTPHYSKGMTDDQSPTPIFFTCLVNAAFKIIVACRDQEVWSENLKRLQEIMDFTFLQYGFGAKTALGYGVGESVCDRFSVNNL
ncbi:type III-B CRISPR module RAMP protein Cmr6 [Bacilliculturomica massiliensis]|uniref:type III-B CRISPR module RAMP protein Cmr6 n=1 Tax=Bacilliculturomica massiliensis TaxID=1917867 RepID=UPI0010307224|nr:type III-B CRISPR module RAMP protein Cmr6 [Bacilliculturomica massiliensis]